jgi:hypothetical protein
LENRDLIVYCDRASNSARTLARVLGCRRWFEDSTPGRKTAPVVPVVINWGASDAPNWIRPERWPWPNSVKFHMLNSPGNVLVAINKKDTLQKLTEAQVPCLEWTGELGETTQEWLAEDGKYIARTTLTGSSGNGLRVVADAEHQTPAPLFTRYYPKTHEFRVHVWKGQVIDFTQKRLSEQFRNEGRREIVRSHDNGWVHAHTIEGGLDPEGIAAIKQGGAAAITALGLDFGAADVLAVFGRPVRSLDGKRRCLHFKCCEVNTGPGLENTITIKAYTDAIDAHYESIKRRKVIRPEVTAGG